MSNNKFRIGDKVRILVGQPCWSSDDPSKVLDMRPDLVGTEWVVTRMVRTEGEYSYSLTEPLCGGTTMSWFHESQIELVPAADPKILEDGIIAIMERLLVKFSKSRRATSPEAITYNELDSILEKYRSGGKQNG